MGKGGGCIPSKKRAPISDTTKNDPVIETQDLESETTIGVREASIIETREEKKEKKKLRVFIVYYSMYGHVESLARELKEGVDSVEGVEGVLYRVPETLPKEVLEIMKAPPAKEEDGGVPVITAEELTEADGVAFGFPTRFGSMAAQMKAFFDSTGKLWQEQKLAGKPAGFFVSTGTQGGGQETTAWTAITQLVHHGMLYVPVGYTFGAGMFEIESIRGGSPYGAGVFAGDGTRQASHSELALAHHQGKYLAATVKKLSS